MGSKVNFFYYILQKRSELCFQEANFFGSVSYETYNTFARRFISLTRSIKLLIYVTASYMSAHFTMRYLRAMTKRGCLESPISSESVALCLPRTIVSLETS